MQKAKHTDSYLENFDPSKLKSLAEITEWREYERKVEEKSRNSSREYLAKIYGKDTHFVYELMQNADDKGAKTVKFQLKDDELLFFHDGPKDFTISDIYAITGVGYRDSDKRKANAEGGNGKEKPIGKFGIGFKSVFAITKVAYVYNRKFNFRIEDYTVPYEEPARDLGEYTTIFKLPFTKNSDEDSRKILKERIFKEFKEIDVATIMFLNNIKTVIFEYKDEIWQIRMERERAQGYEIITDAEVPDAKYLAFKNAMVHASMVFMARESRIVKMQNTRIYSFLPTDERSELGFLIDAPFDLKVNRGMIDFQEPQNREILADIKELLAKSLEILKENGYVDADFLDNVMPIDQDLLGRSVVYDELYGYMSELLAKKDLLPTTEGEYVKAGEGILYTDMKMPKLLKNGEIWLDISTGRGKIRKFLIEELGVKTVNIYSFAEMVVPTLDKDTSKEWLYEFYGLCAEKIDSERYFLNTQKLRYLPIIMTKDGKFRSACNSKGEEILFRPSKGLKPSQVINALFIDSKDEKRRYWMGRLLQGLGIGTRTPAQTIRATILSHWEKYDDRTKTKKFFEINDLFNSLVGDNKEDVKRLLRTKPIFKCTVRGEPSWKCAEEILRGSDAQRLLYEGLEVPILDERFWRENVGLDGKEEKGTEDLCRELGMIMGFPFVKTGVHYDCCDETRLTSVEIKKYGLSTVYCDSWWSRQEHIIRGLKRILDSINSSEQTVAIVKLLAQITSRDDFVEIALGCSYRAYVGRDPHEIPAKFMRLLNGAAWVVTENGQEFTSDILRSDFVERFGLKGQEVFLEWVEFKSEAVDALPPADQELVKAAKELSDEEREEVLEFIRSKQKRKAKKLKNEEELVDIESRFPALRGEITEQRVKLATLGQGDLMGDARDGIRQKTTATEAVVEEVAEVAVSDKKAEGTEKKESTKYKKALGDYGENKIRQALVKKYGEENLKTYGGNNKGYDYKVERDGKDELYIEVKTVGTNGHVDITPTEWNYAKVHREKYVIYILDANTAEYMILENPYGLYLEGKINLDVMGFWFKTDDEA